MGPLGQAYVGCAGWSLPREHWPAFAATGTHLQRYATRLNAVEVNSSFYRAHRPQTYGRWASSTPPGFRFSVKMPKLITHVQRLVACEDLLDAFFSECSALGAHLGCVLVQLPPSLMYQPDVANAFFSLLRRRFSGGVVIEPRHESWVQAQAMLVDAQIGQVAADPSRISSDASPAGWPGLRYWRLHGSPKTYYSAYSPERLQRFAHDTQQALEAGIPTWCIFDNTAAGAALPDALSFQAMLR
ncbi:DUF72 domain-containing protein [Pseudomonas typographi]|uniref:DUF72 domain-containing protein n=1 Tax=Pseudomonas typographi TaxID=2715964 RepID=A0ABR7YZQ0_9PSED|nr:DUF72 domain-containing protein [Pseudomonas typographi]MBD1598711.1 DUF72 domain-containing protein [Pseudomonas typographi]